MSRHTLQFGDPPASAEINRTTAPTAAPTSLSGGSVKDFNFLMMDLLSKAQSASPVNLRTRELNLEKESLSRVEAGPQGDEKFLSPQRQADIRSGRVQATEGERSRVSALANEFERKVENLPSILNSLQSFAKSFEDTGDRIISHTFKEDASGNVTWVGITENNKVITRGVGDVGSGRVTSTPTSSKLSFKEANDLGLPNSLVGRTETDVLEELQLTDPPQWFIDLIQSREQQTLLPGRLALEWEKFRQDILSGESGIGEESTGGLPDFDDL